MSDKRLHQQVVEELSVSRTADPALEAQYQALSQHNQQLQALSDSLKQQLAEKTIALDLATSEALIANKAKCEFMANMSHEIRTPLTAIIGFAEMIGQGEIPPHEQERHIDTIINTGHLLLVLFNDILDISMVEADQLSVETVAISLGPLLNELIPVFSQKAQEKDIEFTVTLDKNTPSHIQSDPVRLKQILSSLLSNAIKFTEQGNVCLDISYQSTSNQLLARVTDTGIGISEQHATNIFKPFSQEDNSARRELGSSGVGLAISKHLAGLLGGDISFTSIKGHGTKFVLTTQCGSCQFKGVHINEIPHPQTQLQTPSLSGNVLLVEDNLTNQELIRINLERVGLAVDIAINGQEGVEQALQNDYDLVLMDIQMPVLDGKEALAMLRTLGFSKPIYAITANVMYQDLVEYEQLGFDGYLSKPLDLKAFYKVLIQHLPEAAACQQTYDSDDELAAQIAELKQLFIAELPDYKEKLQQSIDENDQDKMYALVHTLKGVSGNFNLDQLYTGTVAAQKIVKNEPLQQGIAACASVIHAINKIIEVR